MNKKLLLTSTLLCFLAILTSCKKENTTTTNKVATKKIDFATKVYAEESGYGNDLYFADSEFCVVGFGFGIYSFDKKTNELTISYSSIFGSESEHFTYNKENDELTYSDGTIYKFSRYMTEEELQSAKELKESIMLNQ